MKGLSLLAVLLFCTTVVWAQTTGGLKGKVTDPELKEGLPFASVVLEKDGVLMMGTQSDFDGNYSFSNIDADTCDLVISYVGFATSKIAGVVISKDKFITVDIEMKEDSDADYEVFCICTPTFKVPLVEQDNTSGGQVLDGKDIRRMPFR